MSPSPIPPKLSPPLKRALSDIGGPGGRAAVSGLYGAAPALVIAAYFQSQTQTLLAITPTTDSAEALLGDLTFMGFTLHEDLLSYPQWDCHPYDGLTPHIDIHAERLATLTALSEPARRAVVVAPVEALMKRVLPTKALKAARLTVELGGQIDPTALGDSLSRMGYLATDIVAESASFSVRGGIVDLFPAGHNHPVRIELWGDTVDSLRQFDPDSQRSIGALKRLEILPIREEILSAEAVARGIQGLRALTSQRDLPSKHRRRLAEDLKEGIFFPNVEYFLPALAGELWPLLDHLPTGAPVVVTEPPKVKESLNGAWDRLSHRRQEMLATSPLLPEAEALYLHEDALLASLAQRPGFDLGESTGAVADTRRVKFPTQPTSGIRQSLLSHRGEGMLTPLVERVQKWADSGITTYVACHSPLQAKRLGDMLRPYGLSLPPGRAAQLSDLTQPRPPQKERAAPIPLIGSISQGFSIEAAGLALLSEADIFGKRSRGPATPRHFLKNAVDSFSQLKVGDFVVHAIHGIGVFNGLSRVGVGESASDFVQLEYAGGDRLYLPVHRLHTLQRYVGSKGGKPKLDKMGGQSWAKTTRKVKQNVLKIARQLLDLYAKRAVASGRSFTLDELAMESFEASFPYDETPDQLEAIHAVLGDMTSPRPMDRLVCGDVGYGKTEVALRAAWLAVLNGCQVAVLVPTTVLAYQHYLTFVERFKDLPVNVAQMSRFVNAAKLREVKEGLKTGGIDIVVGTHRVLSADIRFRSLGLLIVDEEHRFGVRHKEHIKKLRKDVDVLTMTATPIPRTLHMATAGLRDLSVIATPPKDRSAIRTYVTTFSASRIKEAIREELARDGQVFFVHNRVQSIDAMARYLSSLVPEGRFDVVHGQLKESRIEAAMKRFIEGETTVLVTTSIVESGLDIPRANTIIINRADRLGLAQLYQLRGRVGRSDRRAFAYLLTPAGGPPTKKAYRRLRAMETFSELGAGFKIANEDLEMRGAGDLLGKSQSGSIAAVGFETYVELLHKAVQELTGEEVQDDFDPEIDIKVEAYVPDDYIPEFQTRLELYRRLATATNELDLASQAEELADRHGSLPPPVKALVGTMEIRVLAKRLRISHLKATTAQITLRFDETSTVDRARIVRWAMAQKDRYRLSPDGRFIMKLRDDEQENLSDTAKNLLRRLT